jgi:hypothetical protein
MTHTCSPSCGHTKNEPLEEGQVAKGGVGMRFLRGRLGFIMAFACGIHCMAMPVLVLAAPALAGTLPGFEIIEWICLGLCAALIIWQVVPSYRLHGRVLVPFLAFGGLALMLTGLLLDGTAWHQMLMVSASVFISAGFWVGQRYMARLRVA